MSAKQAKRARQAARAVAGLSKEAERSQREFEAAIARTRAALIHDDEIRSLAPRRRALALAGLSLFALAVLACVAGALS